MIPHWSSQDDIRYLCTTILRISVAKAVAKIKLGRVNFMVN
jgi:hypothetical protein